jgi:hypothetical protein
MPDRSDQHHRGRKPRHPRAVAIVRAGYCGADERVAEHRKRDRAGEQGEIVERPVQHASAEQDRSQQHRRQRDGNVNPVDRGKSKCQRCCCAARIGFTCAGRKRSMMP